MNRKELNTRLLSRLPIAAVAAALTLAFAVAPAANAHGIDRGVRQEMREGYFEVEAAKRKAERRIERCETRACVEREMRRGYRDVEREKTEARREIRRELLK